MTLAARTRSARPRLGFLGVGWIGRNRLEAIVKSELAEVAAVADTAPDIAKTAQASAKDSVLASSLDGLLDLNLDGLVIATPSAFHAEQAMHALDHGIAVFCQKPLGRTAEEVRHVVNAAKRANRLLGVDLSYRFVRGMAELRERIHSGELGQLYAVDLVFHNAYGPDKAWFYDSKLSGGGCAMDLGIHLLDLALWMLPNARIERVTSRLFAQGRPIVGRQEQVEDYAVARLDLASGTAVQLACSWKLPAGRDAVIEASFYGTKGGAALRNVNGSFYDFTVERFRGTSREILSAPPDDWGGRAAVAWAQKLSENQGFDSEAESFIEAAIALDRIYSP